MIFVLFIIFVLFAPIFTSHEDKVYPSRDTSSLWWEIKTEQQQKEWIDQNKNF